MYLAPRECSSSKHPCFQGMPSPKQGVNKGRFPRFEPSLKAAPNHPSSSLSGRNSTKSIAFSGGKRRAMLRHGVVKFWSAFLLFWTLINAAAPKKRDVQTNRSSSGTRNSKSILLPRTRKTRLLDFDLGSCFSRVLKDQRTLPPTIMEVDRRALEDYFPFGEPLCALP